LEEDYTLAPTVRWTPPPNSTVRNLGEDWLQSSNDDENLGCGVSGQLVGFGGEKVRAEQSRCYVITETQKASELNSGTFLFRFRLSLAHVHLHTFR